MSWENSVRRREQHKVKRIFLLFGLLCLLPFLLGFVFFGFGDGLKVNAGALLTHLTQDRGERDDIDLPIYEFFIPSESLSALNEDLPTSGRVRKKGYMLYNGIKFPVTIKYRGMLKLHWGGPKRSFRVYLKKKGPFGKIRTINFVNPKAFNFIKNYMTAWIAKQMGVAAPLDKLVFVKVNGKNYGVMEMIEQVTGRYERIRNQSRDQIPVYRGDKIPEGDTTMVSELLYESEKNWVYKSNAAAALSDKKLSQLISLVNEPVITEATYDSLEQLIDIDAYMRFQACLMALNTVHVDQIHNQYFIFNTRKERFYPVLWDPSFMWPADDMGFYQINDPLAYVVLTNPQWRKMRDRYLYKFLQNYHVNGRLYQKMKDIIDLIRPSVYADKYKYGVITANLDDVFAFSNVHFESSHISLRERTKTHYNYLLAELSQTYIAYELADQALAIRVNSNVPVTVEITGKDTAGFTISSMDTVDQPDLQYDHARVSFELFGEVAHIDAKKNNRFDEHRYYIAVERAYNFAIDGELSSIDFYNAITREKIQPVSQ